MDCKINPQCTGGVNCHVYDSLNCKGCCSGGDGGPPANVHFFKELADGNKNYATGNHQPAVGICVCCKDPPCQPFPKSCQNFGGPVLIYEMPSPKFEGMSIHQQDFRPKPVPVKEMPPWHPILKDRWKAIDVPSFNKSTYQSDFTPQVVTKECRKPVYLAPKEKKDRCQELSEAFKTWRKTTKGPAQIHEVCDKPIIMKTTVISREPEPSSEHHQHKDTCYRVSDDTKQLHGPECEKHCFSAPLMCHVKSSKSDRDQHHVGHSYDERIISNLSPCNKTQYPDDLSKVTTGQQQHMGLISCEAVETHPTQNVYEYSANLGKGILEADSENECLNKVVLCQRDIAQIPPCYDHMNPSATTCITMNHPAGDGYECYLPKEQQRQFATECNQDFSHSNRNKHVRFAKDPEIIGEELSFKKSERYPSSHAEHEAGNLMKPSYLTTTAKSNEFTLCEDMTNNQLKDWWKKTTCVPKRNNIEVADVPQNVTQPFCPSYLTIHKRDFTEPYLEKRSRSDSKVLSAECGCTGNISTEKCLCPEYERGGII